MRILACSHRLDYTGAPLILFRLLRDLRQRHEITILLPRHGDARPLQTDYEALGIPCHSYINPSKFDILLANTLISEDVVRRARGLIPILWWIHEPAAGAKWLESGGGDSTAFGCVDRLVFPTRWQYEALYKPYVGATPYAIVPYGIGLEPYLGPPPQPQDPADLHLLHLGIISYRKGVDLTLDALRRLANPHIKLTLMGSQGFQPDFVARAKAAIDADPILRSNVQVFGEQPPGIAQAYMAHCDALLFPTRDDLITLTILEALLHGRCVLSSDFGPIPETVIHGETGLLSKTGDSLSLAANIDRIFHDRSLIATLGKAGRAIYDRKHSFAAHVAAMEEQLSLVARR